MDPLSTMSEIKRGCTKSLNLFCLCFNARIIMSLCYVLYRHHCAHIIILFALGLNHPTNLKPPSLLLLLLTPHESQPAPKRK
ncbi:hypothetical protein E2542_SST27827 [Spatholobus suberectus]|nr:hypothetical protein E2542_SST27827 [Spatholobus suberectus]